MKDMHLQLSIAMLIAAATFAAVTRVMNYHGKITSNDGAWLGFWDDNYYGVNTANNESGKSVNL